jgi:hypothetical protein
MRRQVLLGESNLAIYTLFVPLVVHRKQKNLLYTLLLHYESMHELKLFYTTTIISIGGRTN